MKEGMQRGPVPTRRLHRHGQRHEVVNRRTWQIGQEVLESIRALENGHVPPVHEDIELHQGCGSEEALRRRSSKRSLSVGRRVAGVNSTSSSNTSSSRSNLPSEKSVPR